MDGLQNVQTVIGRKRDHVKIYWYFFGFIYEKIRPFADVLWALWYEKVLKNNCQLTEKGRSAIGRIILGVSV